jgi:methionine-rich copper-binding protein CopC
MVYADGDNNLESAAIADVNEMEVVGSRTGLNIVVELDRVSGYDTSNGNWTDTRRARIIQDQDTNNISSTFTSIGESNMGAGQTLTDFIQWAVSTAPADNYLLVLWDHGGGLDGICWDDSNSSDCLSVAEVRQAISAAGTHIEVVGMDACLMSMVEMAHELSPVSDVMVGSEETEPGEGWPYDTILADLAQNTNLTPEQVGASVVTRYGFSSSGSETQSAVKLSQLPALSTALDSFAQAAMASAEWTAITQARNTAAGFAVTDFRDLGTFLETAASCATDGALRTAASNAFSVYQQTILSNSSGPGKGGTGMTVYLPEQGTTVRGDYTAANFAFLADTAWEDFLVAYTTGVAAAAMHVSGSSPAASQAVSTAPTTYTIDFSSAYDPASVQARDLTVNGRAADSVTLVDSDTLRFQFQTAPMTAPGTYAMSIASGAITRSGTGEGVRAWAVTFRVGVPDIDVPSELAATVVRNGTSQLAFDLRNQGNWALEWNISTGLSEYGYTDSDHAGGPTYSWVDISSTGTRIQGLDDDSWVGLIDVGFAFPFYGQNFSSFWLASNGYISFSDGSSAYDNTALPSSAAPKNMIALAWDDLNFAAGGAAYYQRPDANTLIIEYLDVPYYGSSTDKVSCEAILRSDGTIKLQYLRVDQPGSTTVGIQNSSGDHGLQVVCDSQYLHSGLAIAIAPDHNWLTVTPGSTTTAAGGTTRITATFNTAGLSTGTYQTTLLITSNDPDEGELRIPVTLDVTASRAPEDVAIDFGAGGFWLWKNGVTWQFAHSADPAVMAAGDFDGDGRGDLVVSFGSGNGTWIRYADNRWEFLHSATAVSMASGDMNADGRSELVIGFVGNNGTWEYTPASGGWRYLHRLTPSIMACGDLDGNGLADVAMALPSGNGTWIWKNESTWQYVHPLTASALAAGDINGDSRAELALALPSSNGLWTYGNGNAWTFVHPSTPTALAMGDLNGDGWQDLVMSFGAAGGTWKYVPYTRAWTFLHGTGCVSIATADLDGSGRADVVLSFANNQGSWVLKNETTWQYLHHSSVQAMVATEMDGSGPLAAVASADALRVSSSIADGSGVAPSASPASSLRFDLAIRRWAATHADSHLGGDENGDFDALYWQLATTGLRVWTSPKNASVHG